MLLSEKRTCNDDHLVVTLDTRQMSVAEIALLTAIALGLHPCDPEIGDNPEKKSCNRQWKIPKPTIKQFTVPLCFAGTENHGGGHQWLPNSRTVAFVLAT